MILIDMDDVIEYEDKSKSGRELQIKRERNFFFFFRGLMPV